MMAAFPRKVLSMQFPKLAPIKPIDLPDLKPIGTDSKKQSLQEWHAAGGGVPKQYKGREHVWHAKVKKFAEGGEVHMAGGGDPLDEFSPPRYRSAGRRPESQNDRRAAANMPIDFARGVASGVLGAPGDIESLIRMIPGLERSRGLGDLVTGDHRETYLPTSEDIEKRIPLRSDTPAGRAASGLGTLAGGFYMGPGAPIRLVGGLPQAVYKAGKDFGRAAGQPAANVVKPKGGNWLKGSVEDSLSDLKGRTLSPEDMAQAREIIKLSKNPEYTEGATRRLDEYEANLSLNNFIDKKIAPYIRNDMATPDDPLRAMAERYAVEKPAKLAEMQSRIDAFAAKMAQTARERGVPVGDLTSMRQQMIGLEKERDLLQARQALHTYNPEDALHGDWLPEQVAVARMQAGFPTHGLGVSPVARAWENASDNFINVSTAGKHNLPLSPSEVRRGLRSTVDDNPWIAKVPSETPVYYPEGFGMSRNVNDLGFDHLMDELRNATRPTSGLPKNLLIDPTDLNKITLPQAVDRVADINAWRATQKMEADLLKANNEATQLVKEYPEKGLKWVELKTPEATLPEGASVVKHGNLYHVVDDVGNSLSVGATEREAVNLLSRSERETLLADALKYEGDIMKHCVGGYCPDVIEGRSRIYSLRDAKGQPHATVEVQPNQNPYPVSGEAFTRLSPAEKAQFREHVMQWRRRNPDVEELTDEHTAQALREAGVPPQPDSIVQIKGKGNQKPSDEYLPYVQDFVRSGKWSDVNDLQNTGLIKHPDTGELVTRASRRQEMLDEIAREAQPPEGMAKGGVVRMGKGGAAKEIVEGAIKGVKKLFGAADEAPAGVEPIVVKQKVDHPLVFPRAAAKTKEDIRPIAQRMAEQVTGDFVRQNPKLTTNPVGKSRKQYNREQEIPLETRRLTEEKPVPFVDYESKKGNILLGVPGDPTLGGVAKRGSLEESTKPTVELTRVGDITPDSPVPLFGGPRYGDEEKFWASNYGAAAPIQNNANELAKLYEAPVLGQYIKMAPGSENFAVHNLDALLAIQQPEKLNKSNLRSLNSLIKQGSLKYGKFPGFAGFEDPIDVLLQAQLNPKLRKHIAEVLTKPTITESLGLPSGLDVVAAITHPQLRNLETGASGFSIGEMRPGSDLRQFRGAHPTYDTDIPGSAIGQSRYPIPVELAFPDTTAYARSQMKPGVQEFNMIKMLGPRERIDQQYIDEIKMYEELMKEYTGKKKGGAVKKPKKPSRAAAMTD
jgi:hypothetical protein